MKTLVIIFSFLLIAKVLQTQGHKEDTPNAVSNTKVLGNNEGAHDLPNSVATNSVATIISKSVTQNADKPTYSAPTDTAPGISLEPRGLTENQQNLKETTNKMKEQAIKDKEDALKNSQLAYDKFKGGLQKILDRADAKHEEETKIAAREHMRADVIAGAIWRDALQKWTAVQKNVENEYKEVDSMINEKLREIQQIYDAALQAADEQFVKAYTQAEENRKKVESENKEVLAKGRTEYENAVKSAEEKKTQAELEFSNAATNYDNIPLKQWTEITATFETAMEAYERALQEADRRWQNILDQVGIGKQYQETIDKAIMELVDANHKAKSNAEAARKQYDEELKRLQTFRNDVMKLVKTEKEKAELQYKDARTKSKNDAKNKYDSINKKSRRKHTLVMLQLKKTNGEFKKAQAEIHKRFDEVMNDPSTAPSGKEKDLEGQKN